jgi:hypothetical protein
VLGWVQGEVAPSRHGGTPGKCLKFCMQNPAFWCIIRGTQFSKLDNFSFNQEFNSILMDRPGTFSSSLFDHFI